jgi:hypothetical protein
MGGKRDACGLQGGHYMQSGLLNDQRVLRGNIQMGLSEMDCEDGRWLALYLDCVKLQIFFSVRGFQTSALILVDYILKKFVTDVLRAFQEVISA